MRIKIDSKALINAINKAERACNNIKPAYSNIGELMLRSVDKNFRSGGRPVKWKPLKKIRKPGQKILVDTARLKNSMTYASSAKGVEVGTNTIYAATHQFGRDRVPARPFLVIQEEDERKIIKAIDDHIGDSLK